MSKSAQILLNADSPLSQKMSGGSTYLPIVTQWVARARANGGNPSIATANALDVFWATLQAASLDSFMVVVNPFAPDDWNSAMTPLVVGNGFSKWTDSGLHASNLGSLKNGITGDGVNHLDTGSLPGTVTGFTQWNFALSVYASADSGNAETYMGCEDSQTQVYIGNEGGKHAGGSYNNLILGTNANPSFVSFNVSYEIGEIFQGTSSAFTEENIQGWSSNVSPPVGETLWVFDLNSNGASGGPCDSGTRLSFAALHFTMSPTQCQVFFNAVQALRIAFGGGFV